MTVVAVTFGGYELYVPFSNGAYNPTCSHIDKLSHRATEHTCKLIFMPNQNLLDFGSLLLKS
jgi:hypothetical protein